jgi:hypothetical protein
VICDRLSSKRTRKKSISDSPLQLRNRNSTLLPKPTEHLAPINSSHNFFRPLYPNRHLKRRSIVSTFDLLRQRAQSLIDRFPGRTVHLRIELPLAVYLPARDVQKDLVELTGIEGGQREGDGVARLFDRHGLEMNLLNIGAPCESVSLWLGI